MKTGFIYLRPTELIAFRAHGPYSQSAPDAWERMFAWMGRFGLRGVVKRGFGMAHDDPRKVPGPECRYDACIELPPDLPKGARDELHDQRLPGGPYARHRFVGPHTELGRAARQLREQWASRHGLDIADDRPLVEIYLDDPAFCDAGRLRTDICLPVVFVDKRSVA